jgi:hypothetical protein
LWVSAARNRQLAMGAAACAATGTPGEGIIMVTAVMSVLGRLSDPRVAGRPAGGGGCRGQTPHLLGTMYRWCRRAAGKLLRTLSCLLSALLSR